MTRAKPSAAMSSAINAGMAAAFARRRHLARGGAPAVARFDLPACRDDVWEPAVFFLLGRAVFRRLDASTRPRAPMWGPPQPRDDEICTPRFWFWLGFLGARATDWFERRDVARTLEMPSPGMRGLSRLEMTP